MKKSKQAYYDKHFERNWNNIKRNGKESNLLTSSILIVLSLNNDDTIINLYDIVNTFNNYFAPIAETTKTA